MYLSIDIGGTKTLLALFSPHGYCLKRFKFLTDPEPVDYIESLQQNLQKFIPSRFIRHLIRAITVAIPGIVTTGPKTCSFRFGNLNWARIDLITPIKNLFSCKIFFVNDANLATLYEANRPDCNKGKSIYLTFSTGIGGGIAVDGKLIQKDSDAFEPGHVKYKYQGRSLEWEDIAAASALISAYKVQTVQDITGDDAELNDLIARLSLGLYDIIKNESPDTIIIGGPICFIYDKFSLSLERHLRTKMQNVPIFKKAHRPTESVIYGAYLYSKQNYRK